MLVMMAWNRQPSRSSKLNWSSTLVGWRRTIMRRSRPAKRNIVAATSSAPMAGVQTVAGPDARASMVARTLA